MKPKERRSRGRKSPCQILGVDSDATQEEIQEAYLLLLATYGDDSFASYPVVSPGQRKAILSEVESAFQALKQSPEKSADEIDWPADLAELPPEGQGAAQPTEESPKETAWSWLPSWLSASAAKTSGSGRGADAADESGPPRAAARGRLSAGDYLKSVRTHRGLSLREIADMTKIGVEHLKALEEGNYQELPAGSYRRLMLTAYARSLELSPEFLLKDLPES